MLKYAITILFFIFFNKKSIKYHKSINFVDYSAIRVAGVEKPGNFNTKTSRNFTNTVRKKGVKIMCTKIEPMTSVKADSARNYEAVELRITYFTSADVFMEASTDVGGKFPAEDWGE